MSLEQLKKQAFSFLNERFKVARLVFTDVTHAELLAEEATNKDPCTPDAKTMTTIAEASFEIDDYWRIVDVLHNRLRSVEWKQWKQSYKSLVLLEFLLTHGPEELADEFKRDSYIIEALGTFKHVDERGFDWGEIMHKKSQSILQLLKGGQTLKESRLRALKITREIQGFGSSSSPSTSSSILSPNFSPSFSFASTRTSSFGSYSTTLSPAWSDLHEGNNFENSPSPDDAFESHIWGRKGNDNNSTEKNFTIKGQQLWECPLIEEDESLLDPEDEEKKPTSLLNEVCTKLVALSPTSLEGAGFGKASNKCED
ncbi:epsin-3-like isoform X2 [Cucurbita moschata]|uniref:Epsin-3-like isoform X2 n=1 Tax=Cucurbita moschata TaxID=3662 RepID=A0A6J1EDG1_CUCMO|nr:epsin-3-like isoform X2 [Cucurbita moschata]